MKIYTVNSPERPRYYYNRIYIKDNIFTVLYFLVLTDEDFQHTPHNAICFEKSDFDNFINNVLEYITYDNYDTNLTDQKYYGTSVQNTILEKEGVDETVWFMYIGKAELNFNKLNRQDYCCFASGVNQVTEKAQNFVPWTAWTYNSKSRGGEFFRSLNLLNMVSLFCPSSQLPLLDGNNYLYVYWNVYSPDFFNLTDKELYVATCNVSEQIIVMNTSVPRAIISGEDTVEQGKSATYSVNIRHRKSTDDLLIPTGDLFNIPLTFEVESTAGYIPVRKFSTDTGIFEFTLYTDHIPRGTVIDVKINCGNYTRIGSKEIIVE